MSIYLKEFVEESVQIIFVRLDGIGQPVQPAVHKGGKSQDTWFQVDHSTVTDSGWRGNSKVLHLKHDCHHLGRDKDIM